MTFAYIVRCRFTAPDKEAAWNAWYSGPKTVQMLRQPHFRTLQRFRRVSGNNRAYLALWTVTRPEALTTREYKSQWGFAEWQSDITDWSRDLFDGRPAPETAFAVELGGALRVVSFDGMNDDDADAARPPIAAAHPAMLWLPIAGLDRHTPLIGLEVLPELARAKSPDRAAEPRIQQSIYQPICELKKTDAV